MANRKKGAERADRRYQRQIYLGLRPDGTRMVKTVYGKTDEEAEVKRRKVLAEIDRGIDILGSDESFECWADRWYPAKARSVSVSMANNYSSALVRIKDVIGSMPISQIRVYHVQSVIDKLAINNPQTGRPTSKKRLIDIRMTAKQVFDYAIMNRAIDFNPAQGVLIPKNAPQRKRRTLTAQEIRWVEETPHRMQIAAMIMIYAGLRRGELIPLRWSDIDLAGKSISVTKSVEMIKGRPLEKAGAKTAAGVRTIYIPEKLVKYLKEYKKTADSILVCPSAKGEMMSAQSWRTGWESLLTAFAVKYTPLSEDEKQMVARAQKKGERASTDFERSPFCPNGTPKLAERFTSHCLRHTYATTLYYAQVPLLDAVEQFGHSDIKVLLNVYTHLDKLHKQRDMKKLDDYLNAINEST